VVLLGVSEHGVTPVRTYRESEAYEAGLIDADGHDDFGSSGPSGPVARTAAAGVRGVLEQLRRRTVRS
jgi:hypothetical protein